MRTIDLMACQHGLIYSLRAWVQVRHLKGGHVYCGPTLNGEKVGAAVLDFANGDKYIGGFQNDTMEGHGVYEFAGHGQYAGQVRGGRTAISRICLPSPLAGPSRFHSTAELSLRGVGRDAARGYSYTDEKQTATQWADGAYHGAGVWSLPKGPSFRGGHAAGARHGWGVAVEASGAVYEGQWVDGHRQGLGSQRCEDGSTYVGEFRCEHGLAS